MIACKSMFQNLYIGYMGRHAQAAARSTNCLESRHGAGWGAAGDCNSLDWLLQPLAWLPAAPPTQRAELKVAAGGNGGKAELLLA
jgi:hypothetical protein